MFMRERPQAQRSLVVAALDRAERQAAPGAGNVSVHVAAEQMPNIGMPGQQCVQCVGVVQPAVVQWRHPHVEGGMVHE